MKPSKQTHCADCGHLLDPFGICPNALPEDAAVMTAPVNCGSHRVKHPQGCKCAMCTWIESLKHEKEQ